MSPRSWPEVDPGAGGLHAEWYAANAAAATLTIQRCGECDAWRHPARYRCAHCHSDARSFVAIDAAGWLVTHSVSHRALHPSFAEVVPYALGVVELDVGPRLLAVVRTDDPGSLADGARVAVEVTGLGVPFATPVG
jgi:uncharacterized OB-fold protein